MLLHIRFLPRAEFRPFTVEEIYGHEAEAVYKLASVDNPDEKFTLPGTEFMIWWKAKRIRNPGAVA
jgi:hypothetical protein